MKPRLLDLFCGAGGAAMGYHRAGFDVVGVDFNPQPSYPFELIRADALVYLRRFLDPHEPARHLASWGSAEIEEVFCAVHASPPCQAFSVYGNNRAHVKSDHPNLIPETRELLKASGLPYVIENVPGAPLHDPIQLCGTSFGIPVRRHRLFESNVPLLAVPCAHGAFTERRFPGSSNRPNGRTVCNVGEYRVPLAVQREAMQMPWADLHGISQAVPPVFTEHIGTQLLHRLEGCT